MKPDFSQYIFWAAVVTGIVCVLAMAVLTIQSLVRLFGATPDHENTAVMESAQLPQEEQSSSIAGEQPSVNSVPVFPSPASSEFSTDSAFIREQERRQSIDHAGPPPADHQTSNAVPPQLEDHQAPLI